MVEADLFSVSYPITRIDAAGRRTEQDLLLQEDCWRLCCDGDYVATHHRLSQALPQMAVGQLRYRGLIQSAAEIATLAVNDADRRIEVTRQAAPAPPRLSVEACFETAEIHALQAQFNARCRLFHKTGAAHCCALADHQGILFHHEDVARHNAADKALGEFLLKGHDAAQKMLIFSSRLARELVEKALATGVRVLLSPSAPTHAAVAAAERNGVTLLGFVRPGNINIYTQPQRIL